MMGLSPSIWNRRRLAGAVLALAITALAVVSDAHAQAGGDRTVPSQTYMMNLGRLLDGDYRDALRVYQQEGRGAIQKPGERWIDSIAYHTMNGECYYHMGQLEQALDHYTSAVKLFNANWKWMTRVKWPAKLQPHIGRALKVTPWGTSKRRSQIARYPDTIVARQGQIDANAQIRRGGAVQVAVLFPVRAVEIARTLALAIRRRSELLGPAGPYDLINARAAAYLERRPTLANNWSVALVDVQLGLAKICAGRTAEGAKWLKNGLLAGGQYDHPLTCVALLELGRIAMRSGDYKSAGGLFAEASYSAYASKDIGVLEEALRYGALTHFAANKKGLYPPLLLAGRWTASRHKQLRASLALSAAENYALLGDVKRAKLMLQREAVRAIGRRVPGEMGTGDIGGRLDYVTALVSYMGGNIKNGDAALANAIFYMQSCGLTKPDIAGSTAFRPQPASRWLFHIKVADNAVRKGKIRLRSAMNVYDAVLQDPTANDWTNQPLESLAVLSTPHSPPYERWFNVALERKEIGMAMEISDLARRHRFYSSLPMGGRLLSLRWILEAQPDALTETARRNRDNLLAKYPKYKTLTEQSEKIRDEIKRMPDPGADFAAKKAQGVKLSSLAKVAAQKEVMLRQIAVRREAGDMVFPPRRSTKDIQSALPEKACLWTFFETGGRMHSFLFAKEKYVHWNLTAGSGVRKKLIAMLKAVGNFDHNSSLPIATLSEADWRKPAKEMLELLLTGSKVAPSVLADKFDEIIIVPDGVLWYLPFEALQIPTADGKSVSLLEKTQIRYAPTASLAAPMGRLKAFGSALAVVPGKLHPRDTPEVTQAAIVQLSRAIKDVRTISAPLPAPSPIYGSTLEKLLVLEEIERGSAGPYDWSPLPLDRSRSVGALSKWFSLPWGGPAAIMLPGYRTAAEDSLRPRKGVNSSGHEVFLSICGMMSTGTRTVLLSRWRCGGQTCFDLVREFAQELPHASASDAWQRSVQLAADTQINPAAEPRIKGATGTEPPTARHPFFWSGYMLIDTGVSVPAEGEKQAAKKAAG